MTRSERAALGWLIFVLLLALAVLAAMWTAQRRPPGGAAPGVSAEGITSVRVGSWNIRHFGDRADLDLPMIARIINESRLDVLALQEVKKDGRAVDRLLATLGAPWRSTEISPMTGNSERFAFIFRGDRVEQLGKAAFIDPADAAVFDRLPYSASFRAGRFDFQLISVHLSYTNVERRRREAEVLAGYLGALITRQAEKDVLVLGDFNEQRSRPNIEFFNAAGWGVSVKAGTNLSSREVYDNILYHAGHTHEWRSAGVVLFDELYFGNDDKEAVKVSDHRPVHADFSAVGPDDD
jgi:exonuclease III